MKPFRLFNYCLSVAAMVALVTPVAAQVANGEWIYPSSSGNLLYKLDERGQRIADFSNCGYRGGTESLPNVMAMIPQARWVYVNPGEGDDTALIQAAINSVQAFTPDANGWRGVVFLNAGEYQLATTINLTASGVVLKGAGDSPTTGTRLRATDRRNYQLINASGSGGTTTVANTTRNLTQKLVPAGARTFQVDSTAGLSVGHTVRVRRPHTAEWIADMDMDQLGPNSAGGEPGDVPWNPTFNGLLFDRVITRIEGNWITVDAPLAQTFELKYGGGQIYRYTWSGRIQQVGVEDMYGFSDYASATDELHAWTFIRMGSLQHAWVRNITAQYFALNAVLLNGNAKWVTVADSQCLDPISQIIGGRRYSFSNEGAQLTLVVNCYARGGRHDYAIGAAVPGPNAFVLSSTGNTTYSDTGPHHRWSVGGLFDCLRILQEINVQNRGNSGTGHGWAGGYQAVWNCNAQRFRVRNPPTARNWLVGSIGTISASTTPVGADPPGTYDSSGDTGRPVYPRSIYYGQLQQRLKGPNSEFREVWLGDVDQHFSDGVATETVTVDPAWLAQVQTIDATPADSVFDDPSGNRRKAFTCNFTLDPDENIVAASLTLSLRATGANSADDDLRLDAVGSPQSLSSLGWPPLSTTAPTVRTIEVNPALLADGRLNVAVGADSAVDFAVLHLQVKDIQALPTLVTLVPIADAHVSRSAATTNYGNAATLETNEVDGSSVNRETYMRWDLGTPNGRLIDARVRLTVSSTGQAGNENCATFIPSDTWGETTLNYNNRPIPVSRHFAQWIPVAGQSVEFSVTPQVADALISDGKLSLCIGSTGSFGTVGNVSYASAENTVVANRPQLILTYGYLPPVITITSPVDGTYLDVAGAPLTLTANAQATDGAVTSVAFYDGANLLGTTTSAPYQITASLGGGTRSITAVATDANGLQKTSTVTKVYVPHPPTAVPVTATTPRGTSVDIDLRPLAGDVETPLSLLRFSLGSATNGTVTMLPDRFTARFTPAAGYSGPATFSYTVTDTTRDSRTLLNYSLQENNASDSSGQEMNGTITVSGTGTAVFTDGAPAALAPYSESLALTENGAAGAARVDRMLSTDQLDLKNENWTIAGWFLRRTATNQDTILQLGDSGGYAANAMTLGFFNPWGTLDFRNFNGSNEDVKISKEGLANGVWYHFAIVRNGTTLSFYFNGALVGSDTSFGFTFDNTKPVKFGGVNSTSLLDRWLNGSLADLAVFDSALPAADVTRIATRPVAFLSGQTATAIVNINVRSPIESWRQTHFETTSNTGRAADDADPNDDGIVNKMEFFLARNPVGPNPPFSLPTLIRNGATLDYSYTRSLSAMSQLSHAVEWSGTLAPGSWSSVGVTEQILSADGTVQQVKASIPAGTDDRRFIRLKVE